MKFNLEISEEDLESALIKKLPEYYSLKIIKRQFKIPGGIIDILAKHTEYENVYFVIEIKVGDLTSDSVCQVLRYTQYLNSEKSKCGKRRFYPLLIGSGIDTQNSNGHLIKLLKHFDGFLNDSFYVQYDLFNIGLDGVKLEYYSIENKKLIDDYYDTKFSIIEKLEDDLHYELLKNHNLKREYNSKIDFIRENVPQYLWEKIRKEFNENE